MATNDQAGAVAAAEFFAVDLYSYVFASGDLSTWRSMSDPDCSFCNGVITDVEEMQAESRSDNGAPITVESAVGTTITDGARYTSTLIVEQGASAVHDDAGVIVSESEGGRYELHFAIAWQDGWRMLAVDVTALNA